MLDESLLLLQQTRASWNVQLELAADHHLDQAALRRAVHSCCQRHPLARARLRPHHRARPRIGGTLLMSWIWIHSGWETARTAPRWTGCGPSSTTRPLP